MGKDIGDEDRPLVVGTVYNNEYKPAYDLPGKKTIAGLMSNSSKGGLTGFLDRLVPGNPNSFPTPLLILGLLAIVLILAGVGGMFWQRSHPRDDGDDGDDIDADATPRQLGP